MLDDFDLKGLLTLAEMATEEAVEIRRGRLYEALNREERKRFDRAMAAADWLLALVAKENAQPHQPQ